MVAFSSGRENLHGVKAVQKGSRCALAIWFTFNPEHADKDRQKARYIIEKNLSFDSTSDEVSITNDGKNNFKLYEHKN